MSLDDLRQDLQYAVRTARRSPGFVLAAVTTLALAIGANAAIFSILSGVLLRPLPFYQPHRLVMLSRIEPRTGRGPMSLQDLDELRKGSAFSEMSSFYNSSRNLLDQGEPERLPTVQSDNRLFQLLGVAPLIGRTFQPGDPFDVVVISASLWRRRLGSDPNCLGRKISLDGEQRTVIGVMPESFQFPYRSTMTDLWIPDPEPTNRARRLDSVIARLQPGVSLASARQALIVMSRNIERQYPQTLRGRSATLTPLSEAVAGKTRAALLTLLGAVGLVLLIACANVTNLLLARAARRTHEIAVRAALGAGRGRLIRQLLTESLLLSLISGLGGLVVGVWGMKIILQLGSAQIPRAWEISLDWRVFAFLLLVSVATGIFFGLVPALAASRVNPQSALKQSGGRSGPDSGLAGRRGRWLGNGLVVAEVALSFVLLAGAGLLLQAFLRLEATPPGFTADRILAIRMSVQLRDYITPGAYGRYLAALEAKLRTVPGVRAAGFIQYLPLENWGWWATFSIKGQPVSVEQRPQAELRYVSPSYFETMRIPLRRGRFFTDRDTNETPMVILVNEALARTYFPNQDPVGRETDRGTIIGVVADAHTAKLNTAATPEIYYTFIQNTAATSDAGVSLLVSTEARPEALASAVREAIHQVNPRQALFGIRTMDQVVAGSLADAQLYVWLIGLFAAIAVVLAVSGVYAVISFVVAARTHEFGIRMALGAGRGQIWSLVLGHGTSLVGGGIAVGVLGAIASAKALAALSGVTGSDPLILAAVGGLLALVAIAACLVPAGRALHVDPNIALRAE